MKVQRRQHTGLLILACRGWYKYSWVLLVASVTKPRFVWSFLSVGAGWSYDAVDSEPSTINRPTEDGDGDGDGVQFRNGL